MNFSTFAGLRNLSPKEKKIIKNHELISLSNINTEGKEQSFSYYIGGLHKKECRIALRKMSLYEEYSKFIDFIKKSKYEEKTQNIYLLFDHTLLPFPISVAFKIERIKKPGKYQFFFDKGFMKGLKGIISVTNSFHGLCLMEIKAEWRGADTGINDTIFEIFMNTLGKMGTSKVFRISEF